jgi:hypothetical protein
MRKSVVESSQMVYRCSLVILVLLMAGAEAFTALSHTKTRVLGTGRVRDVAISIGRTNNSLVLSAAENNNDKGSSGTSGGIFEGFSKFFQEFDNFIDDATNRRLGNGASFYGRRKSRFYGEMDSKRKVDPSQPDALEDFQAPLSGGYYQWMPDEDGQMRPVTRMKNKVVERNPNFWDRAFDKDDRQK